MIHRGYVWSPAWPGDGAGDGRAPHVSVTDEIPCNTSTEDRAKGSKYNQNTFLLAPLTRAKNTKNGSNFFLLHPPLNPMRAKRTKKRSKGSKVFLRQPKMTQLGTNSILGKIRGTKYHWPRSIRSIR